MNPVRSALKEINQSLVTLDSALNPSKTKEERKKKKETVGSMLDLLNQTLENLDKHEYKYLLLRSLLQCYQVSTPSQYITFLHALLKDEKKLKTEKQIDWNRFKEYIDMLNLKLTDDGLELEE